MDQKIRGVTGSARITAAGKGSGVPGLASVRDQPVPRSSTPPERIPAPTTPQSSSRL